MFIINVYYNIFNFFTSSMKFDTDIKLNHRKTSTWTSKNKNNFEI